MTPGPDWAGLPEHLLMKVATKHVAQTEAGWAACLKRMGWSPKLRKFGMDEEEVQEQMAERKRDGNCLFVFALVCKEWRKAQLKVGGPLCTRVESDVLLPGGVALAKWALAEGCPREKGQYHNMAEVAASYGHLDLVKWLCGEGGFAMDVGVMKWAAGSGNLKLVQWLRGEGCPWNSYTGYNAVDGGLEVLRWLRANGCPWTVAARERAAAELGYTDNLGKPVDESDEDEYSDEYEYDEYSDDE